MDEDRDYASAGRRFTAFLIDVVITNLMSGMLAFIMQLLHQAANGDRASPEFHPTLTLLGLLATIAYYSVFQSSGDRATPGMRAMGLQVVTEEGGQLSFPRALTRWLFWLATLLTVIGLPVFYFTPRRQTLHDILCRTVVIQA